MMDLKLLVLIPQQGA